MDKYKISPHSWHWRLYEIGIGMWSKFLDKGVWNYERPNLCSYIRTILIYLPLMLVVNIGIYASPAWVLGLIYYTFDGYILYEIVAWFQWIRYVLLVAVIFFIAFLILIGYKKLTKAKKVRGDETENRDAVVENEKPKVKEVSFTHVILQYAKDRHDLICRPVIVDDNHQTKERKHGIS